MDADADPQHPGDMAAQLDQALDDLDAVLGVSRLPAPQLLVMLEATAVA